MKNILDITRELQIPDESVIPFGWDKAKIDLTYSAYLRQLIKEAVKNNGTN